MTWLLPVISVVLTLVIVYLADRAVGALFPLPPPAVGEGMALVYPPGSEMHMRAAEFAHTAHINRLGFRGPETPLRHPDAFRMLVLGDSFTFGWGVDYEACWTTQLERRLRAHIPHVEVLNLGESGAHSTGYANRAEVAIPLLRPDVVVVAVLHGDAGGETRTGITPRKMPTSRLAHILPHLSAWAAYLTGGQPPLPEEIAAPSPPMRISAEQHIETHQRLAAEAIARFTPEERARYEALDAEVRDAFVNGLANPFIVNVAVTAPAFFQVFGEWNAVTAGFVGPLAQSFARIRDVARANGAVVLVAIVPQGPYVNPAQNRHAARLGFDTTPELLESPAPDAVTRKAAEEAGVPCLSATGEFRAHASRTDLYFPIDTHFSPEGHALYAEIIAPKVLRALQDAGALQ